MRWPPSAALAVATRRPRAMPSPVRVTGFLVGRACDDRLVRVSPPSTALSVATRLPRAMPVTGSLIVGTRAGCPCTRVAISYPCCGGGDTGSTSIVTSTCDWRLGRLCLRKLRCHPLLWLWGSRRLKAILSPVPGTGTLVGRACCARRLSPPSAALAVATRLSRALPSPVPVTVSMLGCARASCARTLLPPSKGDAVTSACD
jgi:hypothetical protein